MQIWCRCSQHCGDDGDIDGPGTCRGLPRQPEPPLVELVLVPRRADGCPHCGAASVETLYAGTFHEHTCVNGHVWRIY